MPSPGPFIAVLITLLVVGAIIQLFVLTYRYRKGDLDPPSRTIDRSAVYGDDRADDLLHSGAREDEGVGPDVDPVETDTIPCPSCETLNETAYTFCRNCTAQLART